MDPIQINIRTISPIFVPIELKTGVDRSSTQYINFHQSIHETFDDVLVERNLGNTREYESIEKDSWIHQLFTWKNKDLSGDLRIHVFPNNIGVVVINHVFEYSGDPKLLEHQAHLEAENIIKEVYESFILSLKLITNKKQGDYFQLAKDLSAEPDIFWVSRVLLLQSTDLSLPIVKSLTPQWLKHTLRPKDADDILSKNRDFSMTWLQYVVVDVLPQDDERLDAMILAQYYYSAQEHCNKLLKQAIESAYNDTKHDKAQHKLSRSRVNSRLHEVDYHEHLKYLTRSKRTILEDILACWNYEQITKNGARMIQVCSSKIDETESVKRERSSLLTDLLLVALSFFTVFELSLYLTELSREMMSRPALDFNDDNRSFMLQFIAEIDTDVMFGTGVFLTLLLVILYNFIKSR